MDKIKQVLLKNNQTFYSNQIIVVSRLISQGEDFGLDASILSRILNQGGMVR